jgi:LmbE family N-acetylglucosaminyl deacetylase
MAADKQALLKRFRRTRRIRAASVVMGVFSSGPLVVWWLPFPLALLAWMIHEVWFSDHQFYSADQDYRYKFSDGLSPVPFNLNKDGRPIFSREVVFEPEDTLLLEVTIKAGWLGCVFDPLVIINSGEVADGQAFERNARGTRYVNLTGWAAAVAKGDLRLAGRHCQVGSVGQLWVFRHGDYAKKRLLIVAPHADDAELAAFGLYSKADECWIVTLTAGEVEAGHYRRMGYSATEAALLKGRLRAWNSVTVPRWGGVPEQNCLHLGYFCLQLPAMRSNPEQPVGSRVAGLNDTRPFRAYNQLSLPSDGDGLPTWDNLKADLLHMLALINPEVIVLPHPELDPHPDHVSAYSLVTETLADSGYSPEALLCYANHLHDNDRWPMGCAHSGVPLPPKFSGETLGLPYSLVIDESAQRDKAVALGMMHDLQTPLPLKKRLRRKLQAILAGRRWPLYGEDEFFRKAVRRHELFWMMQPPSESCAKTTSEQQVPRV